MNCKKSMLLFTFLPDIKIHMVMPGTGGMLIHGRMDVGYCLLLGWAKGTMFFAYFAKTRFEANESIPDSDFNMQSMLPYTTS